MQSLQIVLLGQIGSGKTSLFNRITNSQEKSEYGGSSNTMNVYSKEAAFGNIRFRVLDTPGFGSYERKIFHAAGIVAALTEGPVNRILLIVKFERIAIMRSALLQIIAPLARYRPLLTLTITHWDLCKNPDNQMPLIEQTFQKLNINSFIYTSEKEEPILTCQKILQVIKLSQPMDVQILQSELGSQFDLIELQVEMQWQVELSKGKIAEQFHKKAAAIKKFINEYKVPEQTAKGFGMLYEKSLLQVNYQFFSQQIPTISKLEFDFCEILHQITLESRKIAKKCLQQFEKENFHLINEIIESNGIQSGFLLHALLKKELQGDLDEIALMAQQKQQAIKGHCFNYIRKCNYCGQIWMKVEGCEGKTFCGAIPKKDQLIKSYKKRKWNLVWDGDSQFKFELVNQNIYFSPNVESLQQQQYKKIIQLEDTNEQFELGEMGCGRLIEWNKMMPLTTGEMRELIDPGILDYLCDQDMELTTQLENSYQPFYNQFQKALQEQKQQIIKK